jgi:uncharacterized protein YutE (UPF0331/DUF86 family)
MPIQPDDITLNKCAVIERCIRRIREEFDLDPELESFTHTDALTLNIERACQAAIDLAMHHVAQQRLGMPQSSGEAFRLLEKNGLLSKALRQSLIAMTGFRNIAIHEYQELDKSVLKYIAETGYKDFIDFAAQFGVHITP